MFYENTNQKIKPQTVLISFGIIILIQPLLDIASYFAGLSNLTAITTGLRFVLLALITCYGFYLAQNKRPYWITIGVLALFYMFHFLANYLTGYISIKSDIAMYARVAQLPLFYISFIDIYKAMQQDYTREDLIKYTEIFIFLNLITITLSIGLSFLVGMPEFTYNNGLAGPHGIKGWFTNGNSQSVILCIIVSISMGLVLRSRKYWVSTVILIIGYASLFYYGTKLAFYAIYLISIASVILILFSKKTSKLLLIVIVLATGSVYALKSYSPMYVNAHYTGQSFSEWDEEIKKIEKENEKNNPTKPGEEVVINRDYFLANQEMYLKVYNLYNKPLVDEFGLEKVAAKYNYSLDAYQLIDNRNVKLVAASLVYDESNTLQHLFGFEQEAYTVSGEVYDLENDLHGIFYSYGFVGFAIYAAFLIYIAIRGIANYFFAEDFRFDTNLGVMLLAFALIIGAAQFSGNVLKRPNVLFYISLIMSAIQFSSYPLRQVFKKKTDL